MKKLSAMKILKQFPPTYYRVTDERSIRQRIENILKLLDNLAGSGVLTTSEKISLFERLPDLNCDKKLGDGVCPSAAWFIAALFDNYQSSYFLQLIRNSITEDNEFWEWHFGVEKSLRLYLDKFLALSSNLTQTEIEIEFIYWNSIVMQLNKIDQMGKERMLDFPNYSLQALTSNVINLPEDKGIWLSQRIAKALERIEEEVNRLLNNGYGVPSWDEMEREMYDSERQLGARSNIKL